MKTVLVTGCAGFIGWKVSEFLLADGWEVVGVDSLNDTYDVRLKQWRLGRLEGRRGFVFHRLDIGDKERLRALFHLHQPPQVHFDAVINLAARAGIRESILNPWVYFEANVTGTLNLLELCREFGVGKFVLASTSSLYGAGDSRPFHEEAATDCPLSPYAASKKAAETLSYSYHHLHGLDVTVLRYFTVYGPAGRPDMSLFRFVQWISEGRPVLVYGDGSQKRDFTYVDDVARGTVLGLKPAGYEIVNLGCGEPIVLNDAIQAVERLVGHPATLEHRPRHPADSLATWANIDKAGRLLGWTPQTRLQEGLARLVRWYHENRDWAKGIATGE